MTARGIRNNNPGNIRNGIAWRGLSTTIADSSFCVFVTASYGIRALARVLRAYHERHGLNTIRGYITRWAPPSENETEAYIRAVCARLNRSDDEFLDVSDQINMIMLATAIIEHENGSNPYSVQTIRDGVALAFA